MGFLLCIAGMIMILFIPGVIMLPFTNYLYYILNIQYGPLYIIGVGIVMPIILYLLACKAKNDDVELGAVSKVMVGMPALVYLCMACYIIYEHLNYFVSLLEIFA